MIIHVHEYLYIFIHIYVSYNFIDQKNFIILNNGNYTHSGPNVCIDLTIASSSIAFDCEWLTESGDNWRSDHYPILFLWTLELYP